MKLVKSILLAAPATIVVAFAAQAADLPSNEAAPIQYVRVCDAYGSGFFFIPGTNTCLHVGGYVRAEYQYTPGQSTINPTKLNAAGGVVAQAGSDQDQTGMEMRGRIDLDARTQTPWGTAQTVIWLRGTSTDGIKALSPVAAGSAALAAGGVYTPASPGASSLTMERAYIRFAGITAGVSTENFVTMPPYMYAGVFAGFPAGIKQLAYTATFGGGFSSTIAIESRGDTPNSDGVAQYSYVNQFDTGYNLVGNVRYDAAWGYAQLAGAVGNNSYANGLTTIPNSVTQTAAGLPGNNLLAGPATETGYAIGLSGKINLPWIHIGPAGIGPGGDALFLNAAYGDGMLGLIGCDFSTSACQDATNRRMDGGIIRVDQNLIPIGLNAAGDVQFGQTQAWTLGAMLTHYFSAEWRVNLAAQYEHITPPTAGTDVGLQLGNANEYELSGNLIWSPTTNFDIGLEIDYAHLTSSLQNAVAPNVTATWLADGEPGLSEGNWSAKLRLERLF